MSQPLQHRGCADQATAWGYSPKYKQASKASHSQSAIGRVRNFYTAKEKLCIIAYAEACGNHGAGKGALSYREFSTDVEKNTD